ncbi:hypothetical protein LTR64_008606 [Lithohypha guttulata]|uniref:uncharacterized protein n=1 Tax=Lithohypha guttulata TaxID=1690604 RepID=UPI002DE083A8|nr:hypothetical protein LTR51_008786 [Lithohypha guttulata]
MSATTTANTRTQAVLNLLADYELTHSGHDTTGVVEPPNPRSVEDETRQNPDFWTRDYHGVPPYRPINYELDYDARPWARPGVETAFVWVMLNGVGIVAATARLWRNTGGRLNDKIFRFSIGGER